MSTWQPVLASDRLPPESARAVKIGGQPIALFRTASGELLALDNRCPHEGYPLVQGTLKGCVVTCSWHNYKFDGRTGACLMGDEDAMTFPVREQGGQIEVDVTPGPFDPRPRLASLAAALHNRDVGRISRDLVRALSSGMTPLVLAGFGVEWDARHGEYGPSHGLPTLADILRWTDTRAGLDAALPLAQAFDVTAEANLRRPPRSRPDARAATLPNDDPSLQDAVEAEETALAEAIVRGMVAEGADIRRLESAIFPLLADHFLDFGHPLIYLVKLGELARRTPIDLDLVAGALVAGITTGTREDLLPAWAGFRKRWETLDVAALQTKVRLGTLLPDALVDLDPRAAFELTMTTDAPLPHILAALSHAAATRLLRFDVTIDTRPGVQDDWLDLTHRLTFVNAVRHAVERWPDPRRWRLVAFAAHFVAAARPYDAAPIDRANAMDAGSADPEVLHACILAHSSERALAHTRALLGAGRAAEVAMVMQEICLADTTVRGIVVAHLIKTWAAAWQEYEVTGDTTPIEAVVRMFASPIAERRYARRVAEAVSLVVDGRPPTRVVD